MDRPSQLDGTSQGYLQNLAEQISSSSDHFFADVLRVKAVGITTDGTLVAAPSSGGFDAGQTKKAQDLGVTIVPTIPGLHAEENLLASKYGNDLVAVGTANQDPCSEGDGPKQHGCENQLSARNMFLDNK